MRAPRTSCPTCGRSVALYPTGRIYRHDPPHRGRDLLSCLGSLRMAGPPGQDVLPGLGEDPPPAEDATLF